MAVLSSGQLARLRNACESGQAAIAYTKLEINAAVQAIEDWFEANRPAISAAIESAAPGAFSATAKRRLLKQWLHSKFDRE